MLLWPWNFNRKSSRQSVLKKSKRRIPERKYTEIPERITLSSLCKFFLVSAPCASAMSNLQLKTKLSKQVKAKKSTPRYIIKRKWKEKKKKNFKRSYIRITSFHIGGIIFEWMLTLSKICSPEGIGKIIKVLEGINYQATVS